VEARILDVTLALLADQGYSRMSLDEVAARSGVSKPTLYRRWPNKADLATAALRTLQLREPAVDTGSTVGDLTRILQNFRRSLLRPNGMALIGAILSEENHSPELLALFRQRIVAPRRRMLSAVLERARQRGELREKADIDAAVNLLVGAFYARYLQQSEIPYGYPAQLVSIVWEGVRREQS
jgi:AcrR family transcriptional regulator